MNLKQDENKLYKISGNKILGLSGPHADRASFAEYVEKNLTLDKYESLAGISDSIEEQRVEQVARSDASSTYDGRISRRLSSEVGRSGAYLCISRVLS